MAIRSIRYAGSGADAHGQNAGTTTGAAQLLVDCQLMADGDDTLVINRGEGTYVYDADDKRYIDYRLGFGPIILGHGYPDVVKKVQEAIEGGSVFAWTTPYEIELCERIKKMCKVDKVRLTNTGTEATMHALRIARAHTGREKFIKFEGQYHGMVDYFMFSTASAAPRSLGSKRSPINSQATSGIPKGISEYVINLPFNEYCKFSCWDFYHMIYKGTQFLAGTAFLGRNHSSI